MHTLIFSLISLIVVSTHLFLPCTAPLYILFVVETLAFWRYPGHDGSLDVVLVSPELRIPTKGNEVAESLIHLVLPWLCGLSLALLSGVCIPGDVQNDAKGWWISTAKASAAISPDPETKRERRRGNGGGDLELDGDGSFPKLELGILTNRVYK